MSRAIIGVDIDNVLCETSRCMVSYYNQLANDNLTLVDIKQYYIEEFVKPEWKEEFYKLFLHTEFWKTVNIIENAQKYINQLIEDDFRIIFITSTEPYNYYKKSKWLARMFPNINLRDSLISIKDKQITSAYVDTLIDDYPNNLIDRYDDYGNYLIADYKKIIFDYNGEYMWTKDFKCDNINSFRANNWYDAYCCIKGLYL